MSAKSTPKPSMQYNPDMPEKSPKPDESQSAARTVNEFAARHEAPLPADLEAAWEVWSRGLGKVDARGMALLRAAFEAGWEAGKNRQILSGT
jgi:hypothetical protein